MSRTKIGLKGIVRNVPESTVKDGACEEVINMRYVDEAWRPVSSKVAIGIVPNAYERIWIHKGNDYVNYIGYKAGKVYWFDKDTGAVKQEVDLGVSSVSNAEFWGNTANFIGGEVVSILFLEGKYIFVPKLSLPALKVSIEQDSSYRVDGTDYFIKTGGDKSDDNLKEILRLISSKVEKIMEDLYKKGWFEGHILLRYALRMYDGNYFRVSPVLHLYSSDLQSARTPYQEIDSSTGKQSTYLNILENPALSNSPIDLRNNSDASVMVKPGRIKLGIPLLDLSEEVKQIFTGIDIFCTRPLSDYDFENIDGLRYFYNNNPYSAMFVPVNHIESIEDRLLKERAVFYKIDEVDFSDYNGVGLYQTHYVEFDVKSITSNPIFTEDSVLMHSYSGNVSYVMNHRLFLGDIFMRLFKGYSFDYFSNDSSLGDYKIIIQVELEDAKVVLSDARYVSSLPLRLNALLSYPDIRARKMTIFVEDVLGGKYAKKSFVLRKSDYYDLSYFFNQDGFGIQISETDMVFIGNPVYPQISNMEQSLSKVKISELNNPFVFSAKNTYLVGKGKVLGFASNSVALSQGQFGQYPVSIFTDEGLWVMEQGSGDVIYKSIVPVNREVCNNPASITQLDRAIAFTTDKGLMLLMGAEVREISVFAEGIPEMLQDDNNTYEGAVNNEKLVSLKNIHSTIGFKEYLKDAKIGYDYTNKELIISNSDYPYSYVYGLDSGVWHKTTEQYELFINNYPKTLGVSNGKIVDVSVEDKMPTQMLLQTKAMKFDSESYKAMRKVILRGLLRVSAGKYAGFYVFGSYDAEQWAYLGGIQNKDDFRDMVAKTLHTDCKYFKIVFAGELAHDSYINYFELDVKGELQGRMR